MNKIYNIKTSVKLLLGAFVLIILLQISLNVIAKRELFSNVNQSQDIRYKLQTDTIQSDSINSASIVIRID